jgi:hypothetical protein
METCINEALHQIFKIMRWAGHLAQVEYWQGPAKFQSGNLKGKELFGDVDRKVVLERMLQKG